MLEIRGNWRWSPRNPSLVRRVLRSRTRIELFVVRKAPEREVWEWLRGEKVDAVVNADCFACDGHLIVVELMCGYQVVATDAVTTASKCKRAKRWTKTVLMLNEPMYERGCLGMYTVSPVSSFYRINEQDNSIVTCKKLRILVPCKPRRKHVKCFLCYYRCAASSKETLLYADSLVGIHVLNGRPISLCCRQPL